MVGAKAAKGLDFPIDGTEGGVRAAVHLDGRGEGCKRVRLGVNNCSLELGVVYSCDTFVCRLVDRCNVHEGIMKV